MPPKVIGYAVLVVAIVLVVLVVKVWRGELNPLVLWAVVVVGMTVAGIVYGPPSGSHYYHEDDDYRSRGRR